jgi:site-specific recombinase XerD
MKPEHVSVEERPAPTSFLGISSFQYPLVSPSLAVSQAAFEARQELQRKQKIIGSALKRIIERGLCGLEPVKAYLIELYRRNCRPNTLRTHAVTIASFLVYLKGRGRGGLEAIDREAIGGFVEHQQDLGLTPNTISVRLRGLYSFLKFVGRGDLSAEVLTRNASSCCRASPGDRSSGGAADAWGDRSRPGPCDRFGLVAHGHAHRELLDTRLQEVDLTEQKIEIMEAQKTRVGGGLSQRRRLCALRQWLAQHSEKSAYLFHGMGRSRLGYEAVRCRFERYLIQAGLSESGYTLHSLRHTCASELLNAGMRLECLQQLLGHSCIEMTRRYARLP